MLVIQFSFILLHFPGKRAESEDRKEERGEAIFCACCRTREGDGDDDKENRREERKELPFPPPYTFLAPRPNKIPALKVFWRIVFSLERSNVTKHLVGIQYICLQESIARQ